MEYPKVDSASCLGCGLCSEICPMKAIVMENSVARIIEDNCSNCRFCVGSCPVNAIN
jgi:Fe-S-cluster-containing hydrogenase component 2